MTRPSLGQTPSQTVGPYFGMRLGGDGQHVLAGPDTPGRRVRIEGRVLDADGAFIEDALVEVWQADAEGRYRHPDDRWDGVPGAGTFTGFGRARTDFRSGVYVIETILPGRVPGPDRRPQAPHLNLIVQARGMLMASFTRCYFEDQASANAEDAVLMLVPEERRATLVATLEAPDADPPLYRFDIRFGGEAETVFLDI
jgi:protocatechuate 3,4-dioxygenase alpha subunit